tara:strand:- start:413 stop:541 length:129 start_codon:yes stop_codon:yes gene_type:complete
MKFVPINKLPYDIYKEIMIDPGISDKEKQKIKQERNLHRKKL